MLTPMISYEKNAEVLVPIEYNEFDKKHIEIRWALIEHDQKSNKKSVKYIPARLCRESDYLNKTIMHLDIWIHNKMLGYNMFCPDKSTNDFKLKLEGTRQDPSYLSIDFQIVKCDEKSPSRGKSFP